MASQSRVWLISGAVVLILAVSAGVWYLGPRAAQSPGDEACPPHCPTASAEPTSADAVPSSTPTADGEPTASPTAEAPSATLPPPTEPVLPAERIPIIEYHDTEFNFSGGQVMMTTAWFQEQMQYLADSGFHTLSVEEFLGFLDGSLTVPQMSALVTFDIGTAHADNYQTVIIPTLRLHGFQAVFFVLTNAITQDGAQNTVSWQMLREWRDEGLISVQSHGVYHPDYTLLSFGEMLWDAHTSRTIIETEMGQAPVLFAFPFDSVPDNPALVMTRAGYLVAMGGQRLERSVVQLDPEPYALPRYYPYSTEARYPMLVGAEGWTFAEMMMAAIQPLAQERTPTPVPTGTPSARIPSAPLSYLEPLVSYCRARGGLEGVDVDTEAAFPTDVSAYAQSLLPRPVVVRPTCELGPPITPEAIVLHFTGGSYEASVQQFRNALGGPSIHYIIDRDGSVTQMVPEILGAYHVTCYGSASLCLPDCPICTDNQGRLTEPWTRSIGIELVNTGPLRGSLGQFRYRDGTPFDGLVFVDYLASWRYRYWEDYPEAQVHALRTLVLDIMQRWDIPLEMVVGHERVQPEKIDPGPALNLTWNRYGDPSRPAIIAPEDVYAVPASLPTPAGPTEGFALDE